MLVKPERIRRYTGKTRTKTKWNCAGDYSPRKPIIKIPRKPGGVKGSWLRPEGDIPYMLQLSMWEPLKHGGMKRVFLAE